MKNKIVSILKNHFSSFNGIDEWMFKEWNLTEFATELESLINEREKERLTEFIDFLLKQGYCDVDVYTEPPTAIDQFLSKPPK